jgi:oligoendopeptidase F
MSRKPISLRMEPEEWQSFVALCQNEGTTATEQISIFIRQCLAQGLPLCDEDLDTKESNRLNNRINELEEKIGLALAELDLRLIELEEENERLQD